MINDVIVGSKEFTKELCINEGSCCTTVENQIGRTIEQSANGNKKYDNLVHNSTDDAGETAIDKSNSTGKLF